MMMNKSGHPHRDTISPLGLLVASALAQSTTDPNLRSHPTDMHKRAVLC